jgi:hypothetical protein
MTLGVGGLDAMSNTYQCVLVEATLSPGDYAVRLVARARGDSPRSYSVCPSASFPAGL